MPDKDQSSTAERRIWESVLPREPTHSSTALGWRHFDAYRFDSLRCWEMKLPAVDRHFIAAHLHKPCEIRTHWGGRTHRGHSSPGNVMLMAAGQDSVWACPTAIDELHMFLDPAIVEEVAREVGGQQVELIEGVGIVDPAITDIARQVLGELEQPGIGSRLFADTAARALALVLVRRHSTASGTNALLRSEMTARQLRLATDYIEAHLDEGLTLESISAATGMTQFRFARAFRKATGQSPRQFVIARRIECAKELLRSTDFDIVEIANRVGFATQSHFTTIFGRRCGTTPRRYRELRRT